MNWGYKIAALYIGFVVLIVTLVSVSMGEKIELESTDYYAQELKYQDRIDATKNATNLAASISHEIVGKQMLLTIPMEQISPDFTGEVYFYCPSDDSKDLKVAMQFDANGKQQINLASLAKKAYKMKLSWKSKGVNYFKEEVICIP